ncbi:nucleoside triphosphate pyrophosphohydrolase [Alicyclobacillaceae bacterium I2511]|nr:nucleoside triphosphate pyrophosphohydrolase [Alicyclobacillaceae bacterium I2511]
MSGRGEAVSVARVLVVGLGPGGLDSVPLGVYRLLTSGRPVYFRTFVHPCVPQLLAQGVQATSFDEVYETEPSFSSVYARITAILTQAALAEGEVVYAVPGHPSVGEQTVQNLLRSDEAVEVVLGGGQSFVDAVWARLQIDPAEGFLLLDGTNLRSNTLQPTLHTLIAQVYDKSTAGEVKLTLMQVYPDEYPVTVIRAAGVSELERIQQMPLYQLDWQDWLDHLTSVYVPPATQSTQTLHRDPGVLLDLVKRLRAPGGCPWDRAQTHLSLRPFVLEEAYEVAYALTHGRPEEQADELGDLLLQVLLNAAIAEETGEFSWRDVVQALADKLVRRHPHVFGTLGPLTVGEVQALWDTVKAEERQQQPNQTFPNNGNALSEGVLAHVKWYGPPLQTALDLQERAARVGFDWERLEDVLEKVKEEWQEVLTAQQQGQTEDVVEELGDLLFVLVNFARWLQVDAEQALMNANKKFIDRFQTMERAAAINRESLQELTLKRWDEYWRIAKTKGNYSGKTEA